MFLNHKDDLDDSDFNNTQQHQEKRQFNFPILPLIIIGGIILLIVIIFLVSKLFNREQIVYEEKLYFIDLMGSTNITMYQGDIFVEPGYKGIDDEGNDLTQEVVVSTNINSEEIGNYKVSYTLGNVTKERNVKVIDKPTGATYIHLYGDVNVFLYVGEKYDEKGYEVIDTVDGNSLKDKVIVNSNVNTSKEGIYKVIYSVTNTSGITTSKVRTVIVMDRNLSLIPSPNEVTNGNVTINIYARDELFDYLVLPNNMKETKSVSTYEVSNNGTYKFIMYNNKSESREKSIEITNIDREVPSGSCSGYYGSGISQITIKAKDNVGISKYEIDGTSYTSTSIKLNKEVSSVNITIYDKAGNTKAISCKLEDKRPTPSSTKPSSSKSSSKPASSKSSTSYSKPSSSGGSASCSDKAPMVQVLLNKDLHEKVYNITADDLNALFQRWSEYTGNSESPLLGTGEAWIKACEATGLDPLTLVGICGHETGRGGFRAQPWMSKKNFFGMKYVDPTGDGTGPSKKWAGENDLFGGNVDLAVLQSAKRISNFYYGVHGAKSIYHLTVTAGYNGQVSYEQKIGYSCSVSSIMRESLEYIKSLHGDN